MTKPKAKTTATSVDTFRKVVPLVLKGDTPAILKVDMQPGDTEESATLRTCLRPSMNAAYTMQQAMRRGFPETDYVWMVDELQAQCDAVNSGDMKVPEAQLVAQARTLESVFHDLTRLGYGNIMSNFDAAERLLKLALRAQSQCRATLETLAIVKNPPQVTFAKQANIAHGPQQVNNGTQSPVDPARGEI